MFKSAEHKTGYENLRHDYELLTTVSNDLITRLCEKNWDNLVERFYDETMDCFEEPFLQKAQTYMEKEGTDGDLDGFFGAVDYYLWCAKVPHYLIEAYEGYYEDEMGKDLTVPMEEPEHSREWVLAKIYGDTPREQLRVYLEWNGILGWQSQIERILDGFSG